MKVLRVNPFVVSFADTKKLPSLNSLSLAEAFGWVDSEAVRVAKENIALVKNSVQMTLIKLNQAAFQMKWTRPTMQSLLSLKPASSTSSFSQKPKDLVTLFDTEEPVRHEEEPARQKRRLKPIQSDTNYSKFTVLRGMPSFDKWLLWLRYSCKQTNEENFKYKNLEYNNNQRY